VNGISVILNRKHLLQALSKALTKTSRRHITYNDESRRRWNACEQ